MRFCCCFGTHSDPEPVDLSDEHAYLSRELRVFVDTHWAALSELGFVYAYVDRCGNVVFEIDSHHSSSRFDDYMANARFRDQYQLSARDIRMVEQKH